MKHEIDLPDLPDGFEYTGEFRTPLDNEWFYDNVTFDPVCCKNKLYRPYELIVKKTAPASLLDKIKAKYAEYEVVELEWDKSGDRLLRYVYEDEKGFFQNTLPAVTSPDCKTFHPVAVIFTK